MRALCLLWARIRGQAAQRREDEAFEDEIQEHIALLEERYKMRGMSEEEAVRAARRQFGNVTVLKERQRIQRGILSPAEWWRDVRFGMRMLVKTPSVTLIALLTLSLGIGLNVALFSVLDAVMFKTLPIAQPDRLVRLERGSGEPTFTYALWQEIKARQEVFSGVFAYQARLFNSSLSGEKHFVAGLYVSGDYFSTLEIPAIVGRTLIDRDDRRGAAPVAVISYACWRRQFAGDPEILHRQITLEKHSFQIVGVTPRGFYGTEPGYQFDVAIPLEAERIIQPDHPTLDRPFAWWLYAFGRLKSGVSLESARARMMALSPYIDSAALPPGTDAETRKWYMAPIVLSPAATGISTLRDSYGKALVLLNIMLGIVLLIACANIANLQLVRFSARRREFAVRAALGASRHRLFRQLAVENLILATTGAGLGLMLARYAGRLLLQLTSSKRQPTVLDLSIDYRLVLVVIGLTVATAVFFGIAPALKLAYVAPQNAMKQESQTVAGSGRRDWTRFLIPLQLGLSVILLFGAMLFVRSLTELLHQNLGFDKESVLLINTDLDIHPGSDQERLQLASTFQERITNLPGALSVSRSDVTPISGDTWQWDVQPQIDSAGAGKLHVYGNLVAPDFFRTLGTPLLSGRDFDEQDRAGSPLVAILNRAAAKSMFPGADPVGRFYRKMDRDKGNPLIQIVGVVGDAKYRSLRSAAPPTVYIPITQNLSPLPVIGTFEIRFAGGAASMEKQVEQLAQSIDPQTSLEFTLLSEQVSDSLGQVKMIATLASGFSLLALVLASIGMYGVMAYSVSRRTAEIGLRIALGARRSSVLQMVMGESLKLVGIGLLFGIPGAAIGARFIRAMLFGIYPLDPLLLTLSILVICVIAALAACHPAARASRIDPATALRYE
ncbi:ABC transporter permease [Edaphobacter dinghuensis]|nr:ABC transporter permease [Edaphobacter dinghuensis]